MLLLCGVDNVSSSISFRKLENKALKRSALFYGKTGLIVRRVWNNCETNQER